MSAGARPTQTDGFQFVPDDVRSAGFSRLEPGLLAELAGIESLASTVADVLEAVGLPFVVDASALIPRMPSARVVGHAITIRYLPSREAAGQARHSGLATAAALQTASRGDVLVVDAAMAPMCSSFGGNAAQAALDAGMAGIVVDGAIRDAEEICEVGIPVWSRSLTPRTGRWQLEAIAINGPVGCGGVQVRAGDLICADQSGICFVPSEVTLEVAQRALETVS